MVLECRRNLFSNQCYNSLLRATCSRVRIALGKLKVNANSTSTICSRSWTMPKHCLTFRLCDFNWFISIIMCALLQALLTAFALISTSMCARASNSDPLALHLGKWAQPIIMVWVIDSYMLCTYLLIYSILSCFPNLFEMFTLVDFAIACSVSVRVFDYRLRCLWKTIIK